MDVDEILIDVVVQFAEKKGNRYYSGGLSTLEKVFRYLIRNGYAKGDSAVITIVEGDK